MTLASGGAGGAVQRQVHAGGPETGGFVKRHGGGVRRRGRHADRAGASLVQRRADLFNGAPPVAPAAVVGMRADGFKEGQLAGSGQPAGDGRGWPAGPAVCGPGPRRTRARLGLAHPPPARHRERRALKRGPLHRHPVVGVSLGHLAHSARPAEAGPPEASGGPIQTISGHGSWAFSSQPNRRSIGCSGPVLGASHHCSCAARPAAAAVTASASPAAAAGVRAGFAPTRRTGPSHRPRRPPRRPPPHDDIGALRVVEAQEPAQVTGMQRVVEPVTGRPPRQPGHRLARAGPADRGLAHTGHPGTVRARGRHPRSIYRPPLRRGRRPGAPARVGGSAQPVRHRRR